MVAKMCALLALILIMGCSARYFSASTTATYKVVHPDGSTLEANYDSSKNQQGMTLERAADGSTKIHVDESSTSERAITAAQDATRAIIDAIQKAFQMGLEAGKMAGS